MCNFTRNSEPHRSVFSVSFANRTGNKWKGGEQLTALSFMKGEKGKTSETLVWVLHLQERCLLDLRPQVFYRAYCF